MDRSLYIAASEGQVDVLRQHIDQLEIQTTTNSNTALHVAAQFEQLQCSAVILEVCPSLLRKVNIRGETPLHMAAREGCNDIVKALIECAKKREQLLESGLGGEAKKMLRATNVDKDTALHMAVRNCGSKKGKYLEVIKLLTEEDREFKHPSNNDDETPLYLAAERGSVDEVVMLLKTCTSLTYNGPGGRTALHATTFNNSKSGEIVNALLEWKPDLIKELDAYGWTPLHCAARCGNVEIVKKLLEKDKSVAYVAANGDEGNTALHIAAAVGDVSVLKELLSYCPDCWEMVNSNGQNILHIAAYYERELATNFIFTRPWAIHLITWKDNEGNTPLHVITSAWKDIPLAMRNGTNKFLDETPANICYAVNNENRTAFDVYDEDNSKAWPRRIERNNGRDTVRKDRERIIKWKMSIEQTKRERKERENEEYVDRVEGSAKNHMIVATLLATISFAASFTIPGGYHQDGPDEGMAVLVRNAAFKTFVITNTIAVIFSTSSILLYLSASLFQLDKEKDKVENRYWAALWLVMIALVAMTIAFITGTYAVLGHYLGLAIPTCVIACSSSMVYVPELTKLIRRWLGISLRIIKRLGITGWLRFKR